ncbi:MAG: hypothetical protein EBZ48_08125 [Proteobacteria bacterium]|nr:hypothetical protein [Pseudomonadota bacterium]
MKGNDRVIMKPICMAAGELVEAFDQNRLDKLAPGKTIPPKSALRILMMTDQQYLKIYERVSEFLFSFRLLEERKRDAARTAPATAASGKTAGSKSGESKELQSEIQTLLNEDAENILDSTDDDFLEDDEAQVESTAIAEVDEPLGPELSDFNLRPDRSDAKTVARVQKVDEKPAVAPVIHTKKGSQFLADVSSLLGDAKTSEELLSQLLGKLVAPGPFEKAALIVVSQDRKKAIVVACRGPALGTGQTLSLHDELNPLAQCLSRVQSYGRKTNNVSPFGSRSFAVAPIDADHETPVALYADCGTNGALTFEARRIFRAVVGILNEKLPSLPGGIPVELQGG